MVDSAKLRQLRDKERFKSWSHLLLEQAVLAEGGALEDPAGFVQRVNDLIISVAE